MFCGSVCNFCFGFLLTFANGPETAIYPVGFMPLFASLPSFRPRPDVWRYFGVPALGNRLLQIASVTARTSYVKQNLPFRKSWSFSQLRFLFLRTFPLLLLEIHAVFWYGRIEKGRRKYITPTVNFLHAWICSCPCPTRLAYGTVDSLTGKLRAVFNEFGRRGEWDPCKVFLREANY